MKSLKTSNLKAPVAPTKTKYVWGAFTSVVDELGVEGQNNEDPKSNFENHQVIYHTTRKKIYDPSYGKSFSSLEEWASSSVAGFYKKYSIGVGQNAKYFILFSKYVPNQ
jgi:hypothetical protein